MATGPTTLHWLAGCSAHQTQFAGALTPIAPTAVTNTKSGIFVLAAAGAWSPSTAHDQHAPEWLLSVRSRDLLLDPSGRPGCADSGRSLDRDRAARFGPI